MKKLAALLLATAIVMTPIYSSGQDGPTPSTATNNCTPAADGSPRRCTTQEEIRKAADAAIREACPLALEYPAMRNEAREWRTRALKCEGRLETFNGVDAGRLACVRELGQVEQRLVDVSAKSAAKWEPLKVALVVLVATAAGFGGGYFAGKL